MSDLEISDRAITATYAALHSVSTRTVRRILELGSPLIVAAELRRLAELDGPFAFDHDAAAKLRARADELDPR